MATHAGGLTAPGPTEDARVPARSDVPAPAHGVLADERVTTADGSVVVPAGLRPYLAGLEVLEPVR